MFLRFQFWSPHECGVRSQAPRDVTMSRPLSRPGRFRASNQPLSPPQIRNPIENAALLLRTDLIRCCCSSLTRSFIPLLSLLRCSPPKRISGKASSTFPQNHQYPAGQTICSRIVLFLLVDSLFHTPPQTFALAH